MNGRISKKVRQLMRRNWAAFYEDILRLPFRVRLRIAWYIVRNSKKDREVKW